MKLPNILSNLEFLPEVNQESIKNRYPDAYIALIPAGIKNEEALMVAYELQLKPPYFGRNWDSLNEVLHDLGWFEEDHIVVAHEGLPEMAYNELKTMINVLSYAVQIIKDGPKEGYDLPDGKHKLTVIFPDKARKKIEEIFR